MTVTALSRVSDFSGVLKFTAPTGGVTVNIPVKIGAVVVVPQSTAAGGATFEGLVVAAQNAKRLVGVTKAAGATWTAGQALYFHATNGWQTTATSATAGFIAAADALSAATTGDVIAIGS